MQEQRPAIGSRLAAVRGRHGCVLRTFSYEEGLKGRVWFEFLEPFGAGSWTNALFRCPTFRGKTTFDPMQIPRNPNLVNGSYGYNWIGCRRAPPAEVFGLGVRDNGFPVRPVREAEVLAPSDMIAIGDSVLRISGRLDVGVPHVFREDAPGPPPDMGWGAVDRRREARERHNGKVNIVFCDDHVESLRMEEIYLSQSDEVRRRWNRNHEPPR